MKVYILLKYSVGLEWTGEMTKKHTGSFYVTNTVQQKSKTGVNIGSALSRWSKLKGLKNHVEAATFILDRFAD